MRIVTWNVASLPPTARVVALTHGSLAAFFSKELGADVVCLQEVKLSSDKLTKDLACVEGYESFWATSDERKGYSGVTTWCSAPPWGPVAAEANCIGCNEGRVVVTDHGPFAVVNVYVPNAGDRPARERLPYKLQFLERLREKMDALAAAGKQVIAVGDFNVPPSQADIHQGTGRLEDAYCADEVAAMRAIIASYPDAWRRLHCDADDKFTVWDMRTSARSFNRGLRIDFVLLSPGLLQRLRGCEIRYDLPHTWSDHVPVWCDLDLEPPPPRRAPCDAWLKLQRRFVDPNQRSIKAMFGQQAAQRRGDTGAAGAVNGGKARHASKQDAQQARQAHLSPEEQQDQQEQNAPKQQQEENKQQEQQQQQQQQLAGCAEGKPAAKKLRLAEKDVETSRALPKLPR